MHFTDRLAAAVQEKQNPVLVGLDPRLDSLPPGLRQGVDPRDCTAVAKAFEQFCCGIIDIVATRVAVVKPQAAFFEEYGPSGMAALGGVIQHAQEKGLLVVIDGKRNDIGSTATAYANGLIGPQSSPWSGDALTVSPYLGDDSLSPFIEVAQARGGGIYVLVKTSNPGGKMLQDLVADGLPIYRHVANYVEQQAAATKGECGYGIVGAVVGATYPAQLQELREAMPHTWFLVPGFGSQGGTAADVAAGFDQRGLGAIVNNSRGIIFAHSREPFRSRFGDARWQDAVAAATDDMIAQLAAETPAGRLASK